MADENADTPLSDGAPGSDPHVGESQGDYDFGDPGNSAFSEGSLTEISQAAKSLSPAAAAKPAEAATPATPPPAETTTETPPAETVTPAATAPAAAEVPTTPPAASAAPSAPPSGTATETPVPAAPPAAPAPLQLSQEQVSRANNLGLSAEYLSQFPNPEMGILVAENVALRAFNAGRGQAQPQAQPAQQPAQAAPAQPQAPVAPPTAFDETAVRQFWIDQGFDATVAEAQVQTQRELHAAKVTNWQNSQLIQQQVKWQSDAYNELQRLQNVEKANAEAAQRQVMAQAQESVTRDVNEWKAAIDPAFKPLVTPEVEKQILKTADIWMTGMLGKGTPAEQLPTIRALCDQAMYAILGPKLAGVSREQVREEVRAHQGQAIARPSSGGKAPHVPGLGSAVAFAERFAADHPELYGAGPDSRSLDDI